ncbi:MAG: L-threonine 3-dehydrogenase [Anaerolineae bacterium]|nr:L-threonine 3-dehydrogenase [Anaerolineae bacterium]NIN99170.1 L-threonine 3-dehydrogenase [Anaerolineae bacterium]NIQ82011.1 L-threonine 3-dehydrogenase [Anaerolineae bacterium]
MPEKMRAVVKAEAAPGARLMIVDVPEAGPGEVLVKVKATSICGTDVHIYQWDAWARSRIKPPMVFGHEFAGEVVQLGEGVTTLKSGDYVSAETHIVCGACYQCRTGQAHICGNVSIIGVDRPGSFAEYVIIPPENAWFNPPDMPPEVASIQEPFGNAVHSALSTDLAGKTVLVTGCGPIGLMAIGIAKSAGASAVYGTEVVPYRLDLASRMGPDLILNPRETDVVSQIMTATDGQGVDVVLEMSGDPSAIHEGFAVLRDGGYAALLGIPSGPIELDLANEVIFKGASVYGVAGRQMWKTWYQTRALLSSGAVDVGPIITHELSLEDFEQGLQLMSTGQCGKVVLHP